MPAYTAMILATVAFVGGSLVPTGGHNPLEPAVWGVPVLSGPHVHNFVEVYGEMTAAGAAVPALVTLMEVGL